MGRRRYIRHHLIAALVTTSIFLGAPAVATKPPVPTWTNRYVKVHVADQRVSHGERHQQRAAGDKNGKSALGVSAPSAVQWEAKFTTCTGGSLDPACSAAIIDCRMNPNASGPPRLVWQRQVGTDQWYGPQMTCLPGTPAPPDVNDPTIPRTPPPPPVPTIAQIRSAFLELPFAKPSVSMQPVGNKTLVGLQTYYQADWPDTDDLQPGDISDSVKLLSWTIQFKIQAKDYRYTYGDGTNSGWTTSQGGVHPDGDITHTYKATGTRSVKVDARLVGQYRVNGGAWQDLGAVADLQDEPVTQLQVAGTRTRLVDH